MYDILILMLHSVNDKHHLNPQGKLSVYPRELDGYLSAYKKFNYQIISMSDLVKGRYNKNKKFIVLTFDDGFKDNFYCAKKILIKYNARATIFVNPAYSDKDNNHRKTWGFMTYDELKKAEKSGVFDIQAHGMSHEFIFKSSKIIDFYSSDKFNKYYWLAWILFPDSPNTWSDNAYKYSKKIPEGYPIFEYGRRLSGPKFIPNKQFIEKVISSYKESSNHINLIKKINEDESIKGKIETFNQYSEEIKYQLGKCKEILENLLDKEINIICFPGGGYNDYVLKIAEKIGYKCYMNASKFRQGNNYKHLENYKKGKFAGFNRTSLSHFENKILSNKLVSQLIAMICLGDYQNNKLFRYIKIGLRQIKNFKRKKD